MKRKPTIMKTVVAVFSLWLIAVLIYIPVKVTTELKRVFSITSHSSSVSATAEERGSSLTESPDVLPASETADEEKTDFSADADGFAEEIISLKKYNGSKIGSVGTMYLSEVEKSPKYKKNVFKVPSYKQTDLRWKYRRIGLWGNTVGSAGCATTCLAMTESFYLGKTVTPSDMVSGLSYASSGRLYWPSEYKEEKINGTDYVSRIYTLLNKGKPVILGMRKASGAEHWVVITGHKKYAFSLKAENFKINDPGSVTRRTLRDFISEYTVPYKMVYRK